MWLLIFREIKYHLSKALHLLDLVRVARISLGTNS